MDPEIKKSIRKLFIKFILFQVVIFVVALLLSLLFTAYFKQRLGNQLSAASRDSILSGDARHTIITMTSSMSRDFSGMSWRPSGEEKGFSVPIGSDKCSRLLCASARVRVYFDEESRFSAGDMLFYYSRWMPVVWAVIAWLIIALLSLPVAFFERRRLIRDYNILLDLRIKESYSSLAAQVAHDIRSPLAALGAAAKGLEMPEEQRRLMEGAVGRMQGIADDLLQRYRTPSTEPAKAKISVCALSPLIEQVLAEKRLQHKDKAGVKIEFNGALEEIEALVEPKELQRILSNLVNNSVEAFTGTGTVSVGLSALDGKTSIEVKDNGKGIPSGILAKLGQKGETYGKSEGTGLGLYHARTTIESWGGSLKIESTQGKGTAVLIGLPSAANQAASRTAILLDDDMLVHMNWKLAAKAAGIELKAYKTPEDISAGIETLPKDTPVYIDSDLGNNIKGEDIAKDLHEKGFTNITMATGHGPEKFSHLLWLNVTGKEPPF